jgi:hypothetical protein
MVGVLERKSLPRKKWCQKFLNYAHLQQLAQGDRLHAHDALLRRDMFQQSLHLAQLLPNMPKACGLLFLSVAQA